MTYPDPHRPSPYGARHSRDDVTFAPVGELVHPSTAQGHVYVPPAALAGAYPSPFMPAPEPKSHKTRNVLLIMLGSAVVVGGAGVAALKAGENEQPKSGYYTADDIEPAVLSSTEDKITENGYSFNVTDVTCVEADKRQWTCHVSFDDDDSMTMAVQVSTDYQSWVSHSAD